MKKTRIAFSLVVASIAFIFMMCIGDDSSTYQFQKIDFNAMFDIHTMTNQSKILSIDTINDQITIKNPGLDYSVAENPFSESTNMVFNQLSGNIQFLTETNMEWQGYSKIIDRIVKNNPSELSQVMINGKSIDSIIRTYGGNPIYGKKIAVVGDSEVNGAYECSREKTYPNYIVQRNNMMMFQTCCSKLAMPRYTDYNPTNGITYKSLIGNYKQVIPGEVDIIWLHIGYNDTFDSDTEDDATLDSSELALTDEQCRTKNLTNPTWNRSFKKSFNTLIQSLTNEYKTALIGVSIPYNFNSAKNDINTFIKNRCRYYGIECIQGSEECGFTTSDTQYFTVKSDGTLKDYVHLSVLGAKRISYVFEEFMKTRMQISPRTEPQPAYDD